MMVTKGYGFSVNDIDWSCPADMKPYLKAHEEELKEQDRMAWVQGQYILSATRVAIDENLRGRKSRSEYTEKPILEIMEEREYEKKNDRPEYRGMTEKEKQNAELSRAKIYFNSLMARFPK